MLIALFTGWFLDKAVFHEQLSDTPAAFRNLLLVLIRFLAPAGVFFVFVMSFM